jgi:hypothetical protein
VENAVIALIYVYNNGFQHTSESWIEEHECAGKAVKFLLRPIKRCTKLEKLENNIYGSD